MPALPATAAAATDLPLFSLDDIALLITKGIDAGNAMPWAAFDLGPERSLTYDVSRLSPAEARVARAALQAWSDVTGITFTEETPRPLPDTPVIVETADIPRGPHGIEHLQIGQTLQGQLGQPGGRDWIGVRLEAGKTYLFDLQDAGPAEGFEDPWFRLISPEGKTLVGAGIGIDAAGRSVIPFTATQSGLYYLSPENYDDKGTGAYRVTAHEGDYLADILFNNDTSRSAYNMNVEQGHQITLATIAISADWLPTPPALNSYWLETYIHEIGHALGLSHPGYYNGTADFDEQALFRNDSVIHTIMSYFGAGTNPHVDIAPGVVMTPMAADILALQSLYGDEASLRPGPTTYGAGSNVGGYLGRMFAAIFDGAAVAPFVWSGTPILLTLHDTGGIDTLNLWPVRADQFISLRPETLSITGGASSANLAISRGTVIENAVGGFGDDAILGNAAANHLQGRAGDDEIIGGRGADTLRGGAGDDILTGGAGNDLLRGAGGADVFHFTRGHDVIADFTTAMDGVVLAAERWAGLDTAALLDSAELTAGGLVLWLAPQSSLTFRGLADASALADSLLIA